MKINHSPAGLAQEGTDGAPPPARSIGLDLAETGDSPYTARVHLPPTTGAPAAARHLLTALWDGWQIPATRRDDALLIVSELVTNAVVHVGGTTSFELEITYSDGCLRIALADGSALRPLTHQLKDTDEHGRGVELIEILSDRWGTDDDPPGKRIWLELDLAHTDPRARMPQPRPTADS